MSIELKFKALENTNIPPSTQKARGVWHLIKKNPFLHLAVQNNTMLVVQADGTPTNGMEWKDMTAGFTEPGMSNDMLWSAYMHARLHDPQPFARGCPKTPRHGFVPSVRVNNMEEMRNVFMAAYAADNECELLLMSYVPSSHNAVWVPSSGFLAIGPDHDGATGSKNSIALTVTEHTYSKEFEQEAGINEPNHMYVEVVRPANGGNGVKPYVVQARAGDPIPSCKEWILEDTLVEHIISPDPDDSSGLAWETLTESLKGTPGLVAVDIGGSLGAHAALHCRKNGIPYLVHNVKVGEVAPKVEAAIYPYSVIEFQKGVQATECESDIAGGLKLAIPLIHNSIRLSFCEHRSRLDGYAAGFIFRAAAIACLGESRHYKVSGKKLVNIQRDEVFKRALTMSNKELCEALAAFSYRFLSTQWSNSYGGLKWFTAAVSAIKLWTLITQSRFDEAVGDANEMLQLAHNGGWLLNKFTQKSVLDYAVARPAEYLMLSMGDLYDLCTADIKLIPIMLRTERASTSWKQTEAITAYGVSLTINKVVCKPINLKDSTIQSLMNDVYNYV